MSDKDANERAWTPEPCGEESTAGVRDIIAPRLVWIGGIPYLRLREDCCLLQAAEPDGAADSHVVRLEPTSNSLLVGRKRVDLTRTQFRLVARVVAAQGRMVTIEELMADVWGYPPEPGGSALVRAHIQGIRSRLKASGVPEQLIEVIRRVGLRLGPEFAVAEPSVTAEWSDPVLRMR
jgi:DNA-binding winged helix-turn-helix (wHTH) protein